MSIAQILITCIQFLSALGVIGLVLLQQGKGSEMGAAFGSGSAGSLFGVTGSANFLSRTTAVLATVFFTCTLALTFLGAHHARHATGVFGTEAPGAATSPEPAKEQAAPSADSDIPK